MLFCCFLSPSLPFLAPRTMPTRTIHALCSDKRIIIKGDEVIGSKQQEDSIVVGCTLTDSQRAIRCCVCSCHRSLITLEESAPVRYFTQTKGRADRVKRVSYLKVLFVGFSSLFFLLQELLMESAPLLSSHLSLSKAFMAAS